MAGPQDRLAEALIEAFTSHEIDIGDWAKSVADSLNGISIALDNLGTDNNQLSATDVLACAIEYSGDSIGKSLDGVAAAIRELAATRSQS